MPHCLASQTGTPWYIPRTRAYVSEMEHIEVTPCIGKQQLHRMERDTYHLSLILRREETSFFHLGKDALLHSDMLSAKLKLVPVSFSPLTEIRRSPPLTTS